VACQVFEETVVCVNRELLIKNCECPEEGTRNVVAECLGKLTLINPVELLPKLKSYLGRHSSMTRSTVISAIKFTISDQVRYLGVAGIDKGLRSLVMARIEVQWLVILL